MQVAKSQYTSYVTKQPSFNKSASTTSDWNHTAQTVSQQSNHASSYAPESGALPYAPESGFEAADESFSLEEGNIFFAEDAIVDMRNFFYMDHQLFAVSHGAW